MSPPQTDRPPSLGLRRSAAVLAILGRHLWPKNEVGLRSRVVVALVLLILAKVANVYVPILYKHSVDALGDGKAAAVAVPVALIVAYGLARVLAQAFGEVRDAVFAPVSQRAIRNLALEVFDHLHALSGEGDIGDDLRLHRSEREERKVRFAGCGEGKEEGSGESGEGLHGQSPRLEVRPICVIRFSARKSSTVFAM